MNFGALMRRFLPVMAELGRTLGDSKQRIDPSVVRELEEALARLEATLGQVQLIRDTRVDTTQMSIIEIDRMIREQTE